MIWSVVWTPLKKYESQLGGLFPICGKNKKMFQTTQPVIRNYTVIPGEPVTTWAKSPAVDCDLGRRSWDFSWTPGGGSFQMGQGFFFVFYDPFWKGFYDPFGPSMVPKIMTPCRTEKVDFSKTIKKNNQKPNHQKKNNSTGRVTRKIKKNKKKQEKRKNMQKKTKNKKTNSKKQKKQKKIKTCIFLSFLCFFFFFFFSRFSCRRVLFVFFFLFFSLVLVF